MNGAGHNGMKPSRGGSPRPARVLFASRLAAGLALGLMLAGCASPPPILLGGGTWPEEGKKTDPNAKDAPYPSFRAPAQIGDRPVMNAESQTKMQTDLESLAKDRSTRLLKEIEDDGATTGQ